MNDYSLFKMLTGCLALFAMVVILYTLRKTCKFKRDEKHQDRIATFCQDFFHIWLYVGTMMIAFDQLSEAFGYFVEATIWMSPPASNLSFCLAAIFWGGYRIRRKQILDHGMLLTDDLQIKPRTPRNEASVTVGIVQRDL